MFCQSCGTKLYDLGSYCHNCGQASLKRGMYLLQNYIFMYANYNPECDQLFNLKVTTEYFDDNRTVTCIKFH